MASLLLVLLSNACMPHPNIISSGESSVASEQAAKIMATDGQNQQGGSSVMPPAVLSSEDPSQKIALLQTGTDIDIAPKTTDLTYAGEPPNAEVSARLPWPQSPAQAMRPLSDSELLAQLTDDLPLPPFLEAVEEEIDYLERSRRHDTFVFGDRVLSKAEYLQGLRRFLAIGRQSQTQEEFIAAVKQEFDFYEVYGPPEGSWSQAKITAYYEPVVLGSPKKTARFSQALYLRPSDLVRARVRLASASTNSCLQKAHHAKSKKECKLASKSEWASSGYVSRGRYVKRKRRWVLMPYYSRKQIDQKGALKGRHLELCWVDPLDSYFLQIEGSGTIMLNGRKALRVRPADQNGHPFHGYSKNLVMQANQAGLTVEQYLRGLPAKKMFSILNENPSYVFFEVNDNGANTSMGMKATAGRTIATDAHFFPKGALAFLVAKKPKFASSGDLKPKEWEQFSRFVLDQDTGGAIKGGGRVDLFWGEGPEAKRHADVINQQGRLYYLVPKLTVNQVATMQSPGAPSSTAVLLP